jgi:uncharacterized protein YebE (UPF0316 family)
MNTLIDLPPLVLAILIFLSRMTDVSLGTMRTIAVVQARIPLAMVLGFIEVTIWVLAVSQVISRLGDLPILTVAYAGGFAAGNALGITLERRLAIGSAAIRVISRHGRALAVELNRLGHVVASIDGESPEGPQTLVYATCARRDLPSIIDRARAIDPELFYVVERFAETSRLVPVPPTTGWRAVLKKK